MRIFNLLIYSTYVITKRSKNFEDIPVLGGIIFILPCVMFIIFGFFFLIDSWTTSYEFFLSEEYKYIVSFSILLLLFKYYLYNSRYKRIIENFEVKYKHDLKYAIFIVLAYYLISFLFLLFAGMYKNGDCFFQE